MKVLNCTKKEVERTKFFRAEMMGCNRDGKWYIEVRMKKRDIPERMCSLASDLV